MARAKAARRRMPPLSSLGYFADARHGKAGAGDLQQGEFFD